MSISLADIFRLCDNQEGHRGAGCQQVVMGALTVLMTSGYVTSKHIAQSTGDDIPRQRFIGGAVRLVLPSKLADALVELIRCIDDRLILVVQDPGDPIIAQQRLSGVGLPPGGGWLWALRWSLFLSWLPVGLGQLSPTDVAIVDVVARSWA